MTQILDHGKWVRYQPDRLPQGMPPNTLFARRESDGVDWYDYVRDENSFTVDSVKFTATRQDSHNGYTVGLATRDPTRLFPAGALLREIVDYRGGDDLQLEIGNKLYNPDTQTLHEPPPPPPPFDFEGLEARVAAIEAKLKDLSHGR
jgi:hypothetical protein